MTYEELYGYIDRLPIIDTHSHHDWHHTFVGVDLDGLLGRTYAAFEAKTAEPAKIREAAFMKNSFYWFRKAVGLIYNGGELLNGENWDEVNEKVREAYRKEPHFHEWIHTHFCRAKYVILDEHRDFGDDHGLDFVRPAVRIDGFLYGYSDSFRRSGGVACPGAGGYDVIMEKYIGYTESWDDYLERLRSFILYRKRENRAVALKLACAYQRDLRFDKPDWQTAKRQFEEKKYGREMENAIFCFFCQLAAQLDMPIQLHTGLGQLADTRAANLIPIMRYYPETRFVLLHCSFPWTDDALAIGHYMENAYIDLAWFPLLSTDKATVFLRQALDVFGSDRLMLGTDTWTAEEAYGSVLASQKVLCDTLFALYAEGRCTEAEAKRMARLILHENAEKLYRLD